MTKSRLLLAIGVSFAVIIPMVSAASIPTLKDTAITSISAIIAEYDAQILALQTENAKLKSELAALKGTGATPVITSGSVVSTVTSANTGALVVSAFTGTINTGNKKYDEIVLKVNKELPTILATEGLSASGSLGLFEFVEPNAFFLSIDDGQNPTGVTAFKTKLLYTYDTAYNFTLIGKFDLNYEVQKYVTLKGKNPYSSTTRVRIKNPLYKGKLLEESVASTSPSTTTSTPTTTTTTTTSTANPTAKDIKTAYSKNKIADAITLANTYLASNPTDVDVLTVRERSYYITGKYTEALKDVQMIETVQGATFNCDIAKDGMFIAKAAKQTSLATRYTSYYNSCKAK